MPTRHSFLPLAAFAAAVCVSACGTDKQGTQSQSAQPSGGANAQGSTQAINGQAAMGPLQSAWVNAFQLKADGSFGANLGGTTTRADGSFSLDVLIPTGQAVAFAVQGGSYVDEATGNTVTLAMAAGAEGQAEAAADANVLQTWVSDITQTSQVAVTALTTMAAGYAREVIKSGQTDLSLAIGHGKDQVKGFFADPNGNSFIGFDITTTLPLDLTVAASGEVDVHRANYGSLLSGISQLVHSTTGQAKDGLTFLSQLVAVTRQDAAEFQAAAAQARANTSLVGSLDPNAVSSTAVGDLARLAAQLGRALPIAINDFLKGDRAKVKPPEVPPVPPSITVSGTAFIDGPLADAQVQAWSLDGNRRTQGAPPLATTRTDANGAFSLSVFGQQPIRLVTSGGSWSDVVYNGNNVHWQGADGISLTVDLTAATPQQPVNVVINPVTHLVSVRAGALAWAGSKAWAPAQAQAISDVRHALGIIGDWDITAVQAADLTATLTPNNAQGAQVALVGAAAAHALLSLNQPAEALPAFLRALGQDISNGLIDGYDAAGQRVAMPSPPTMELYRQAVMRLNEGVYAVIAAHPALNSMSAMVRIQANVGLKT